MPASDRKHSFGSVTDERTRLLILGSLPGQVSLSRGEYYAHPSNQFWRLIGAVVQRDLAVLPYSERLETLLENGVGLWDVVKSAERQGSLDTAIRNHAANPIEMLAQSPPALRAVGFNGGRTSTIGRKQLGATLGIALVTLPSSSAANCTISFEKKCAAWMQLQPYIR